MGSVDVREARRVLGEFFRFAVDRCRLRPVGRGHICAVFCVDFAGKRYSLRLRPPAFQPEHLRADHALLYYLRARGFTGVPRPILTERGDSVVVVQGKGGARGAELLSWVAHDCGSTLAEFGPGDDWTPLAELIGRYHRLTRQYPLHIEKPAWLGELPISFEQKYFLAPLRRAKVFCRTGDEKLRAVAERAVDLLQKSLYLLSRMTEMPRVVLHNDLSEDNILLSDGVPVGMVDFDFCISGPPIVDLIEGLHGAVVWDPDHLRYRGAPPDGMIRAGAGREFLQVYADITGFLPPRQVLADMLAVKAVSLALYPGFSPGPHAEEAERIRRALRVAAAVSPGLMMG